MLGNAVTNIIETVGNGALNGESADEISQNVGRGVVTGIMTGGITEGLSGTFGKAGDFISSKISNKVTTTIAGRVIGEATQSFFTNLGSQLAIQTLVDATNGDGFNFGEDLSYSLKHAAEAAVIDGGTRLGTELKERQIELQTQSYHLVTNNQTVTPQETVPELEMANNPISPNPIYQYTPSANAQLEKTINTFNRMRSAGRVIRNSEHNPTIINRNFIFN